MYNEPIDKDAIDQPPVSQPWALDAHMRYAHASYDDYGRTVTAHQYRLTMHEGDHASDGDMDDALASGHRHLIIDGEGSEENS